MSVINSHLIRAEIPVSTPRARVNKPWSAAEDALMLAHLDATSTKAWRDTVSDATGRSRNAIKSRLVVLRREYGVTPPSRSKWTDGMDALLAPYAKGRGLTVAACKSLAVELGVTTTEVNSRVKALRQVHAGHEPSKRATCVAAPIARVCISKRSLQCEGAFSTTSRFIRLCSTCRKYVRTLG